MPGQRCLDRDRRRLTITYLADQNDIGILPQDGAQRRCEGEPGLFVNLDLHYPLDAILDRIFDGNDVDAAMLQQTQRSVERGRFA